MKKIFCRLVALMLIAAPVMTSCNSVLDEVAPVEEVQENVVTLTIKMPEQAETRVGVDEDLKLTGWEKDDVVTIYHVEFDEVYRVSDGVDFVCTNPTSGTFTGTLPAGKTLNDYNVALYGKNLSAFATGVGFKIDNMVYTNLKDAIFMAGEIDNGSCNMTIHNNVIKVTNNGSPIEVAWARDSKYFNVYCCLNVAAHFKPTSFYEEVDSYADVAHFTIPTGTSYVFMAPTTDEFGLGMKNSDGNWVLRPNEFTHCDMVCMLFTATIVPTTGVATRTGDIDVTWVQLWADGPKFAEYNVGAENNKPEDYGGYYMWGKAINKDETGDYKGGSDALTGADDTATNLWGVNWRMPTSDELQGLLGNCDVEWTTVNGTNGLKLTGRGIYASNSLFLPAADAFGNHGSSWGVDSAGSIGSYWSSTPYVNYDAYYLDFTENRHNVITCVRGVGCSARAVFIGE